jgi:hypothetical protein
LQLFVWCQYSDSLPFLHFMISRYPVVWQTSTFCSSLNEQARQASKTVHFSEESSNSWRASVLV